MYFIIILNHIHRICLSCREISFETNLDLRKHPQHFFLFFHNFFLNFFPKTIILIFLRCQYRFVQNFTIFRWKSVCKQEFKVEHFWHSFFRKRTVQCPVWSSSILFRHSIDLLKLDFKISSTVPLNSHASSMLSFNVPFHGGEKFTFLVA